MVVEFPEIDCICCKSKFPFKEVKQVVVQGTGKKDQFFAFCCLKCLKVKDDGSVVGEIEPYGVIRLITKFGITAESLKQMVSHHLMVEYQYKLFESWRP